MIPVVFLIILSIFILWLIGFIVLNDFSVPSFRSKTTKALFIFPHPDDEAFNCGGLLKSITKNGSQTTLAVLTLGERGNPDGKYDHQLKIIRKKEMEKSAKNFHISKLLQEDFGDGQLKNKRGKLEKYIDSLITSEKPDTLVTYDLSGLYGHPDHMIVSEIVTRLVRNKYPQIILYYPSRPLKVISRTKLPEHMAQDNSFKNKRTFPNGKLFIGFNFFAKTKAISIYRSQRLSFRSPLPKYLPLWFVISCQLFEYYYIHQ